MLGICQVWNSEPSKYDLAGHFSWLLSGWASDRCKEGYRFDFRQGLKFSESYSRDKLDTAQLENVMKSLSQNCYQLLCKFLH